MNHLTNNTDFLNLVAVPINPRKRRSPSPPLESDDENKESQSLILHHSNASISIADRVSSQSAAPAEVAAVKETVRDVFKGFTDAAYQGPRNINRWDRDQNFLRYDFPNLSLSDYLSSVSKICELYHGYAVGITGFENASYQDKPIGCFAGIYLHKHREQSEDDYEEILRDFPGEKHALHTDVKSDWGTRFNRKFSPAIYMQKSQERRNQQLSGMQKVADIWNNTNKFDRVFIPSTEFRIKELKHLPEYVACTDMIILAYKPLPSVLKFGDDTIASILRVAPTTPEAQQEARIHWDAMNQSTIGKAWNALPSIFSRNSSTSNRVATPLQIEEVSNNEAVEPTSPRTPSSPNEPQEPPSPKENFFSFFLESSGHA